MIATCSDRANRSLISSQIGEPVHIEVPKSRRAIPTIHTPNCFHTGWSRPKRARSCFNTSSDTAPRSPARRSSTTSPGITRMRKKVRTATPIRVGTIKRKRFSRYFHIPSARRSELLREPDRVQLVVQVVAGGDGPALDLGAVHDDPVPLQRVDHVRLLVEEPLLERAEILPPLLEIERPRLLLEQLVDDLVLVLAVVRVGV